VLAAAGLVLPAKWKVERSIVVNASPQRIYPLIANFKTGWPRWSAFDFMDPKIQYRYSGPSQGTGASRYWVSKQGNGTQRIVKSDPDSGIQFELEMERNKFHITGRIALQPAGRATKVTWTDSGVVGKNPLYRWMAISMDLLMGKKFERSLAALKKNAEAA
jgi:hypothetical protein